MTKGNPDNFGKRLTFKGQLSTPEAKTVVAKTFVTAISQAELACRLAEAVLAISRPYGDTAEEALDRMDDDAREQWLDAADAAIGYIRECIMDAQEPH